jgi:methionine-rich copper-binding protein CopC
VSALRLVSTGLSVLAVPTAGAAHARLVRASPADGASLATAPRELALCFNERLDRHFHAIEVGSEPTAGGRSPLRPTPLTATVDSRDGTCVIAELPSLAPGAYVVRWRVVSRDGHVTRGQIQFRVGGAW